jgi:hypothetical protein
MERFFSNPTRKGGDYADHGARSHGRYALARKNCETGPSKLKKWATLLEVT